MAVLVDTIKISKRLQKAGASQELAEAIAEEVAETSKQDDLRIATKADLEIAIKSSELRIIKWIVGICLTIVTINVALTAVLIAVLH